MVQAYVDLAILGLPSTIAVPALHPRSSGMLVWATSMFASYAVFGHHRPLNAVIVVGVVLVANMCADRRATSCRSSSCSASRRCSCSSASHVFDEQSEWLRRRIGDPATHLVGLPARWDDLHRASPSLRLVLLTQTAASAPLAGAWDGVEDGLLGDLALGLSASCRPVARHAGDRPELRPERAGPAGLEHRRRDGAHHPARPDRQDHLLLARRRPTTRST